jgi:predicted HTH transcriptional regulator
MPTGTDGGIENDIENGIDDDVEKNTEKILNAILANPKITQKRLADETGLSVRTVARELRGTLKRRRIPFFTRFRGIK